MSCSCYWQSRNCCPPAMECKYKQHGEKDQGIALILFFIHKGGIRRKGGAFSFNLLTADGMQGGGQCLRMIREEVQNSWSNTKSLTTLRWPNRSHRLWRFRLTVYRPLRYRVRGGCTMQMRGITRWIQGGKIPLAKAFINRYVKAGGNGCQNQARITAASG